MTDPAMRAFLGACGSNGPLILGVEEPGAPGASWRVLDQPFAVVGRDPGSDIILNDPAISRRHAYIQLIAGRLFCVDLQSRTGTRWGDEPGLWGWVPPGPGVRVGPFRLRARDDGPGPGPSGGDGGGALPVPVSRSFEQPSLSGATLEIVGRKAGPASWRASRALVLIGGSRACKVRLEGEGVANVHASLLRTAGGVFVVDLLAPGGVLVNGERIRCARLGRDDELSVGTHRIRVRCDPAPSEDAGPAPRPEGPRSGPGELSPFPVGAGAEDATTLARLMIAEFGQLQGQAAGRFQETLVAILQSFAGAHREQMYLIREEIALIRELVEARESPRLRDAGRSRAIGSPPVLRLVSGDPSPGVAPPSRPALPPRARPPAPVAEGAAAAGAGTSPGSDSPRPRPLAAPGDVELHALIYDRIAEMQGERRGRWQKLVESLLGRAP